MTRLRADLLVVGGGFGGSLVALIARRLGLEVVLVERGSHPRIVIGESSTPMANLLLGTLARRYDLDALRPFTTYGSWRRTYPRVTCGLKRGFSYFHHDEYRPFGPRPDRANELLVAANPDAEHGDTHWWRADFDAHLFGLVQESGIPCFDRMETDELTSGRRWRFCGTRSGSAVDIEASFICDATGGEAVLARSLGLENRAAQMCTSSRAVYGHFTGVRPWQSMYAACGGTTGAHPFDCDDAALHHLLRGGWLWCLRFDNEVTSAGVAIDARRCPAQPGLTAGDEWSNWLKRYPVLDRQFAEARPRYALRRTGRLQRHYVEAAGENWVMLPNTASFVDPLHSTGIAHNLAGIARLGRILEQPPGDARAQLITGYHQALDRETQLVDRFVHGCYLAMGNVDLFTAYSMLYFVAATYSEHLARTEGLAPEVVFLLAHETHFRLLVERFYRRLCVLSHEGASANATRVFTNDLTIAVRRYNVAGLCDPAKHNMYEYCEATPNRASDSVV